MDNKRIAITTHDNPYDPFDNFTQWYMYDCEQGYNTCGYLARIVKLSDDMTEKEKDRERERAIDAIIEFDPFNMYKKVFKYVKESE